MAWKNYVPFVLALVFGLLAAKVGRDVFARSRHTTSVQAKLTTVVIARADIEPGSVLSEQDLALGQTPNDSVPQSAFKTIKELVGRVPMTGMVRGMVILEPMLAPAGTSGGAQALVPPGMRLITVEINEFSGVAGLIAPGARVDVVATLADQQSNQTVTKTVVQNVKVIAVGQRLDPPGFQSKKGDKVEAPPGRSVTMLVTPHQAEVLEFVSSSARLRLTLRGPMDAAAVTSRSGVSVAELLERPIEVPDWFASLLWPSTKTVAVSAPATRPAETQVVAVPPVEAVKPAPQPRVRTVEVINGSELTTVQYKQRSAGPGSAITTTQDEQRQIGGNHD